MYRLIPEEELAAEQAAGAETPSDGVFEGDGEEVDNLDLESIIKELEDELDEDEDLEESDNPYDNNEQHNQYKNAPKGTTASVKKEKFSEGDESLEKDDDDLDENDDKEMKRHLVVVGHFIANTRKRNLIVCT